MPTPNARLSNELRVLVWNTLTTNAEQVIDQVRLGMPVYPMIDEAMKACVAELGKRTMKRKIASRSNIYYQFPCVQPERIQRAVLAHVSARVKDSQIEPFYLDLIVRTEIWEIESMLTVLYDLHHGLRTGTAKITILD